MPDFFCETAADGLAALNEADSAHAQRALRLRPGDALRVVLSGQRYEAVFEVIGGMAYARLGQELPSSETSTRITLYQGLPKGDKLDQIVRQATELGVHKIVPCLFSRCVAGPEKGIGRMERLNKIAREAAMQSGRAQIPKVADVLDFKALREQVGKHEQSLIPYELESSLSLRNAYHGAQDVAIVIGPEGGFTREEVISLKATPITLGRRILRTETAGIAVIAMLLAVANDF
jgi:16S rRNA (uracil1498-N3)-methyltransferase